MIPSSDVSLLDILFRFLQRGWHLWLSERTETCTGRAPWMSGWYFLVLLEPSRGRLTKRCEVQPPKRTRYTLELRVEWTKSARIILTWGSEFTSWRSARDRNYFFRWSNCVWSWPADQNWISNLKAADQSSDPDLRIKDSLRHNHVTEVRISSRWGSEWSVTCM